MYSSDNDLYVPDSFSLPKMTKIKLIVTLKTGKCWLDRQDSSSSQIGDLYAIFLPIDGIDKAHQLL